MKSWRVDYSILYTDDKICEASIDVEAATILDALAEADQRIPNPMIDEAVKDTVIWNVGIYDDDPFGGIADWIDISNTLLEPAGSRWQCSGCRQKFETASAVAWDRCPNCGALMTNAVAGREED